MVGTALLAGCASLPPPPRAARAWNETLPGIARDEHPAEQVRVGDRIVIAVSDSGRTLERTVWVEGNGKAHVAGGQDVEVAGVSLKAAEQRIGQVLRARDRFAQVDIRFTPISTRQIVALGAVTAPGSTSLVPALRVSGLVAAHGGLVQALTTSGRLVDSPADVSRARLLRNGVALPIDLERALVGEPGHDVLVHPGDMLYIPYASANGVAMDGMVGAPQVVSYRSRLRLTEALATASGIEPGGDKSDVRLIRGPTESPIAYRASLRAIADEEAPDAVLLPGDVVFVEDHWLEDLGEVLQLFAPLASVATTALITTVILME